MKPAAAAALTQAQPLLAEMQQVLAPGGTAFLALPTKLSAKLPGHIPKFSGPLAEGSSAAEDFLLEYLDDKPLSEIAWGRATPAEILRLLALHPLAYTITARPPAIAQATATQLAHHIVAALTAPAGEKIQILVGHDTNIADLAGLLNLHWSLGGYPADDPPPGGGLIFTLLSDSSGQKFVEITYQVQTPTQIRNLTKLSPTNPPATQTLTIPGCPAAACPLTTFEHLLPP
jgi:4-phytase/acid phosphatase